MVNKQIIPYILILFLIGVVIFLILTRPDSEKPAIIKHETEITNDKATIDSLLLQEELLKLQLKEDSQKTKLRIAALNGQIRVLKKEVQELRPAVQVYLDSIPVLQEFVGKQDSVIQVQGELIDSLQTWGSIERMKFNRLILASDEKFNLAVEVNQHYKAIDAIRKKENRRLKKVNRLLLVAIPTAFVGGVLLAK